MYEAFWHRKIQGICKNLNFDSLKDQQNNLAAPYWHQLKNVLTDGQNQWHNEIQLADQIADASDRFVLNQIPFNFNGKSSTVAHLLSGNGLDLTLDGDSLLAKGENINRPPEINNNDNESDISLRELFWWLWRCLPEIASQEFNESVLLIPASKVLPDASLWSHRSLTAAMAGALTGFRQQPNQQFPQLPHLVTFSFSPVQELIKASRKMRDFWAGSYVLHYLSAKIAWKLAYKYGPDSLIYPSLFQQPLIDHWLRQEWPRMKHWVKQPGERALLTAGFPNVIVAILPEDVVEGAMQNARQILLEEWLSLGKSVFGELRKREWTRNLPEDSSTWNKWLKNQWQTYWTGLPIGSNNVKPAELSNSLAASDWLERLNHISNLPEEKKLFQPQDVEFQFIESVQQFLQQNSSNHSLEVNVGSWWPYLFDQLRFAAASVKNSRNWKIPTAFLPRSTISGIGSVVYNQADQKPNQDEKLKRISEPDTAKYWETHGGLFDGVEQLNATETLKRTLHRVLPQVLFNSQSSEWEKRLRSCYPDLSSGVAGWLRTNPQYINYFKCACNNIKKEFDWTHQSNNYRDKPPANLPWGIPWVDESVDESNTENDEPFWPNPRLLNAGWLIDDFEAQSNNSNVAKQDVLKDLQKAIARYFRPGNNPTDWYVIAAGDGDGMGKWLKGENLKDYQDYMPSMLSVSESGDKATEAIEEKFEQLKQLRKRMGPSTHNALSRALLDFSNQLVPYLTEQRYAGRLIYSGGDDVLAYTNLWEWERWLWDIHECFRGATDPQKQRWEHNLLDASYHDGYFDSEGDYWQQQGEYPKTASGENWQPRLASRPLFTMGQHKASLSFGLVIAHHSVPLAIALEHLWAAEAGAKRYKCGKKEKDAVQVKVLFGSGNVLQATSQFSVFNQWTELVNIRQENIEGSLFEQAAQLWKQHPAPAPLLNTDLHSIN